jgi:hypothetical protein
MIVRRNLIMISLMLNRINKKKKWMSKKGMVM